MDQLIQLVLCPVTGRKVSVRGVIYVGTFLMEQEMISTFFSCLIEEDLKQPRNINQRYHEAKIDYAYSEATITRCAKES